MENSDVKRELNKNGLHIWQLCDQLGCSRNHYYDLSHHGFKDCEDQIRNGLKKTITANKKAGATND